MQEHEPELSGAERELEDALASLTPAASVGNIADLLYRAGFEAGRKRTRPWHIVSGALAAALMMSLFVRPAPRIEERVVLVQDRPLVEPRRSTGPDTRLVMHEFPLERSDWWTRLNRIWTAVPQSGQRDSYFGVEAPAGLARETREPPLIRQLRMQRTLGVDPADLGGTSRFQSQTSGERPL